MSSHGSRFRCLMAVMNGSALAFCFFSGVREQLECGNFGSMFAKVTERCCCVIVFYAYIKFYLCVDRAHGLF